MRSGEPEKTEFRRGLRTRQTDAERRLWHRLRDRRLAGFKFTRQESVGPYVVDFICREARLIVEADGSQHADSPHDRMRDAWLTERGYRILRFWNAEIMANTACVLDTILAALPPSPRKRGEDAGPLAGSGVSPQGEGEGARSNETPPATPPHPRLPPRFADAEVGQALSPRAGRGGEPE